MSATLHFQTALNFDREDVLLNRKGEMSPRQQSQFKYQTRKTTLGMIGLFGIAFAMMVFIAIGFNSKGNIIAVIPGVLSLFFGWILLGLLYRLIFLKIPTVKKITGKVVRGNATTRDATHHRIEINGQPLKLPASSLDYLNEEKIYTFYFTQANSVPIAIEDEGLFESVAEPTPEVGVESETSPARDTTPEGAVETKFQEMFNFTDADLEANRRGKMSQAQKDQRLADAQDNQGCIKLSGVLVVIPVVAVLIATRNIPLVGIAAVGAVIAYVGLRYMLWNLKQSQLKALENPTVLHAEGVASVVIKHHRKGSRKNRSTVIYHYVSLGGVELLVDETHYHAFKEGRRYAIHYMPTNFIPEILSAEEIYA